MTFNLPQYKNFGSEIRSLSPSLSNQLSQMYSDIVGSLALAIKKNVLTGSDPAATDPRNALFSIGDVAVRTDTNKVWVLTSRTTSESVTWTQVS